MKIHEYQGKEIFRKYGVPVPEGYPAMDVDSAVKAAEKLGTDVVVVKAQIHAGGRGKGGGVKLARSLDEVRSISTKLLGYKLVTHQTGPEGKIVQRLLVEQGLDIKQEMYIGAVIDRENEQVCFMASSEGGVEIEEVAAKSPEKILKEFIDPAVGMQGFQARRLAFGLGLSGKPFKMAVSMMLKLYTVFVENDCSMVEINPLVVTGDGDVIALDAKIGFDDNALFRHRDILEYRDLSEENENEIEASKYGLSYIKLDGNIGCMVNGAGLAMSTMDIIKHYGGDPANFLDVGGGAQREQVVAAFKIITSDPNVKGIFVNIFGGIMKCDVIAQGIVDAVKEVGLSIPLIVRLEGTNVDLGKTILNESGLTIISADSMADGAQKTIQALN